MGAAFSRHWFALFPPEFGPNGLIVSARAPMMADAWKCPLGRKAGAGLRRRKGNLRGVRRIHSNQPGKVHPGDCLTELNQMVSLLRSLTLAVATLGAGFSANAGDLDFRLINQSGYTLNEFYVTTAKIDKWGNDVLGKGTLATGSSAVVNFPTESNDCVYDLKMVFEDGDVLTDTINLCETSSYTIS